MDIPKLLKLPSFFLRHVCFHRFVAQMNYYQLVIIKQVKQRRKKYDYRFGLDSRLIAGLETDT